MIRGYGVHMIICHCNVVDSVAVKQAIHDLLDENKWVLLTPPMVHQHLLKQSQCCGCFPLLMEQVVKEVKNYHQKLQNLR